jgi:hypothetical protein
MATAASVRITRRNFGHCLNPLLQAQMKTSEGSGLGSEKEAAHELNKTDDEASLIGHAIRSCLPFPPCVGHLRGTNPQTTAHHAWQAPIVRRRKLPSVWERFSEGDAREPL